MTLVFLGGREVVIFYDNLLFLNDFWRFLQPISFKPTTAFWKWQKGDESSDPQFHLLLTYLPLDFRGLLPTFSDFYWLLFLRKKSRLLTTFIPSRTYLLFPQLVYFFGSFKPTTTSKKWQKGVLQENSVFWVNSVTVIHFDGCYRLLTTLYYK